MKKLFLSASITLSTVSIFGATFEQKIEISSDIVTSTTNKELIPEFGVSSGIVINKNKPFSYHFRERPSAGSSWKVAIFILHCALH